MSASPWERMDRLRDVPTRGGVERGVLVAGLRWVNAEGVLWPSVAVWAQYAGLSRRALQGALRRLVKRGLLVVESSSRGGPGQTTKYRIVALANGASGAPLNGARDDAQQRTRRRATAHPTTRNSARRAPEPPKNIQENHHQPAAAVDVDSANGPEAVGAAAVDVFARLGIEHLRDHPNATPERLAWIEREAPNKDKPGGWAAQCIREGWAVPPPTEADAKAAERARRDARLAGFDRLPEPERAAIIAEARAWYPNLRDEHVHPADSPAVRGAVARLLAERRGGPAGAVDTVPTDVYSAEADR